MRLFAAAGIAVLVLTLVGPRGAFAQPFNDVPGPHWAADAIAQLAAKGLVEGYPDGTFKGGRAMTRYEMAEVVARMLARVESVLTAPRPPAGSPEVTRDDLDLLLRLVEELRVELADKAVRVPPLEEEIRALRSRMDNVKITGLFRFRYDDTRTGSGGPIPGNGNVTTFATGAGSSAQLPLPGVWLKTVFDGFVTPDVHLIAALTTGGPNGGYVILNGAALGSGAVAGTINPMQFANIDNLFFDWKNAWGTPLEIWLGRFGGSTGGGLSQTASVTFGTNPIQFGPFGLLMNTTGDTWEDSTADSGFNVVDGLAVFGHWANLADLKVQGLIARVTGDVGDATYFSGEDAYGIDANVQVMYGMRVGAYGVANNIVNPAGFTALAAPAPNGPLWHLYGPGGGSTHPVTANCPVAAGAGVQCPAKGSGYGAYVQWDVYPRIHVDAEGAEWSDGVHGGSDAGYQVNFTMDMGAITGLKHGWTLQAGYLSFGQNFYPPYGGAEADISMADVVYPGDVQGVTLTTSFNPVQDDTDWTVYGTFFGGSYVSNAQSVTEYEAGVVYNFAPQAQVVFAVRNLSIAGIQQFLLYRTDVNYQF